MNSQKTFRPSEKLMHGVLIGTGFTLAVLIISAAYAALNYSVSVSTMSSESTLSSAEWNKIVSNFSTIDAQLTSVTSQATSAANAASAAQTTANSALVAVVPTGAVVTFFGTSCPTGWSAADGTANGVKRTDGTSGTLDLRGEFIRGFDGGRGVDTGRTLGSWQNQDWKGFWQTNTGQNWSSGYSHNDVYMWKSTSGYVGNLFTGYWSNGSAAIGTKWDTSEIRPRNVALLYCVKN